MAKKVNFSIGQVTNSNIGDGGKIVVENKVQGPERQPRRRPVLAALAVCAAVIAIGVAVPSLVSLKPLTSAPATQTIALRNSNGAAVVQTDVRSALPMTAPGRNGKPAPAYTASHALLIGISNYQHHAWSALPGVVRDIDDVADALRSHHGFAVAKVIDPTSEELSRELNQFAATAGSNENNRILIYYAGHGFTSGSHPLTTGWLVPRDAPNPQTDWAAFVERAVGMKAIEHLSTVMKSKHVLWVFDSCFSGHIISNLRSGPSAPWHDQLQQSYVRRIITSGSANQKVPDKSIFARYLVAALTGRQAVSSDDYFSGAELSSFLQKKVVTDAGNSQTPQFGTLKLFDVDEGDIIFRSPSRQQAQ